MPRESEQSGTIASVVQRRGATATFRLDHAQVTRAPPPRMNGGSTFGRRTMNHSHYDDAYIAGVLNDVKVVAMVGASANTSRPSYFAMKYLLAKGYRVIPINPGLAGQLLLDQPVVASLQDLQAPVDMIDIFRNSDAALEVTREALALKDKLGLKVIWMQLGVVHDIAASEAEAAGLRVVMNRCPKIEYGRLSGEIGWAGVNKGLISSRRPVLGAGVQSQIIGPKG
jgi:uncharacterized protein